MIDSGPLMSDTNDERGSRWSRWDLHVHTPSSFTHEYGGNDDATWERFITDLEELPPDITVLGINDYLIIDGYARLRTAQAAGRLPNIKLLLPVIEFRLDKFGGTVGALSRVNYHIIFSNHLTPEQIQEQFLNLLVHEYTIGPGKTWRAAPSIHSLTDLGRRIIDSVPEREKARFRALLTEGFNNLNYPLTVIQQALNNSFLKGKYFTAIGKTEWWDVKWNDQSIAEKRNVIESVDFVFIAAGSAEHCTKARQALRTSNVNDRLLDCSDAHRYCRASDKDRIGHCYTWIKADPTFEGLRQVRHAADERIYLGDRPPKLRLVEGHPTKFIRELRITRKENTTLAERWFDNTIAFNHDLVAIIGNKGMGKSALTDIIALTSNSDAPPEVYSFLKENRFRDRRDNKAKHFAATITWESGDTITRDLDEIVPSGMVPQVRYIPQNFFESLCNETSNAELLQKELRKVIFSNLSSNQSGRFATLDALIEDRTGEANRRIDELRGELRTVNREIVVIERELSGTRRNALEDALQQQEAALAAHMKSEPALVAAPEAKEPNPALDTARVQLTTLETRITEERSRLQDLYDRKSLIENLQTRFRTLQESIARVEASTEHDLARLDLTFAEILPSTVNLTPLIERATHIANAITSIEILIEGAGGLLAQTMTVRETLTKLQDDLDAPTRAYQRYLDARNQWEQQRAAIVGTTETPGALENLKARLTTTRNAQADTLATRRRERLRLVRSIHEQQLAITTFLSTLYAGVEARLATHPVVREQLNVNFAARLVDTGLATQFARMINRSRIGAFSEEHAMRDLLLEYDLNSTTEVERFLNDTTQRLHQNQHGETGDIDDLQRQLRKDEDPEKVYNFLYSLEYLTPRYALSINDREVAQLTPGERGSLLLVFYLLIDQDDRPLIVDQPEENLDNQSVYELLVPCIAEAKRRRQLVIVTHNPNLAVVCNAEQIIWSKIDKEHDHSVRYVSGGLENPCINKYVVDVLEGTWPAFEDRGEKYDAG